MYSATENIIDFDRQDQSTRKKAIVAALVALLFWFMLLIYPVFSYTFPMPEKPGILLSFGDTNGGGELASALQGDSDNKPNDPGKAIAPIADQDEAASKQEFTEKSVKLKLEQQTEEISYIKTSKSKQNQDLQIKKDTKSPNLEKIDALKEAESRERQKKREEEKAEKKKEKEASAAKEFGSFFSGDGTGTNATEQGDPDGAPDKSKLEGITRGQANIGGGLAERGVLYEPEIDENSQKVGRIVVRVCVNEKGIVTEAKFTQRGSTSTEIVLIDVAEKAAAQYRFSPSGIEKQCGTISIDFKLK